MNATDVHEIRRNAQRAAMNGHFDTYKKLDELCDAWEDGQDGAEKLAEAEAAEEKLTKKVEAAVKLGEAACPKPTPRLVAGRSKRRQAEPVGALSDDAWHEFLEDSRTPEELIAVVADECERSRAEAVALRARVEALEEAINGMLAELE